MTSLFRCSGGLEFTDQEPQVGAAHEIHLKPYTRSASYIQYQRPLTREHPYFFAQINSLAPDSVITIGIAGPDLTPPSKPGQWNNTVGYQSDTGRCYTSHKIGANTDGQKFTVGDVFGVLVTYFGVGESSTVMFIKNGLPVATRYHFEEDHSVFLPTVNMENGPLDLGMMWPESVIGVPKFSMKNMLHWIRSPLVRYSVTDDMFFYTERTRDELPIQSPYPLSRELQHFEVVVQEVSEVGAANCIAIATCSPVKLTPTCSLLMDYFRWHPDGQALKMKPGQRMGWGILYDPRYRDDPDFDDKKGQVVLCYVSIDSVIVFHKMMVQPAGGWYPLVLLHPYSSCIKIDMERNSKPKVFEKLDQLYLDSLDDVNDYIDRDKMAAGLRPDQFVWSEGVELDVHVDSCTALVRGGTQGTQKIHFRCPLSEEDAYFHVEVKTAGASSVINVGVAPASLPLDEAPGRSALSVGYQSRDGKIYCNNRYVANTAGQRYRQGDSVGIELDMTESGHAILLFSRNFLPVGTRYLNQPYPEQVLPCISVDSQGEDVHLHITWQTHIAAPPAFQVTNAEHWCLPEGAKAESATNTIQLTADHTETEVIQAPYCLHHPKQIHSYNHFEIRLLDELSSSVPPPAIALGTASPIYCDNFSNFRQDFIRFWPIGEAMSAVKQGDLIGWGVLYPNESLYKRSNHLVICYLTINRDVALTRVLYNPPGGFYPVVVMPKGVDRVQLEFGATVIHDHPFTEKACTVLIEDAIKLIQEEDESLSEGLMVQQWTKKENKARYLKPVPIAQSPPASSQKPGSKKSKKSGKILEEVSLSQDPRLTASPRSDSSKRKKKHGGMNSSTASLNSDYDVTNQYNSKSCIIV